jgi:hypothetical protein
MAQAGVDGCVVGGEDLDGQGRLLREMAGFGKPRVPQTDQRRTVRKAEWQTLPAPSQQTADNRSCRPR